MNRRYRKWHAGHSSFPLTSPWIGWYPGTRFPIIPKKIRMLYKTIVLELLEQNPALHQQLRRDRKLLAALNHYSMQLKKSHRAWKNRLSQEKPRSDESLMSSQAMELATKEVADSLSASPKDEDAPISLESAMAYIRKPIPPA